MDSKVLFNKEAYAELKEGVNLICNAVKTTLGPRGKNVLTIDNYLENAEIIDEVTFNRTFDQMINNMRYKHMQEML